MNHRALIQLSILACMMFAPLDKAAHAAQTIYPGEFYRIRNVNSGKCLDIEGQSRDWGAHLIQWDCHDGPNQQFQLSPLGGGMYNIRARHSGLVLDVEAASTNLGQSINQWPLNVRTPAANQQFRLVEQSVGVFRIVAAHSGLALDVAFASSDNGARVNQFSPHDRPNQRFTLAQVVAPVDCDFDWGSIVPDARRNFFTDEDEIDWRYTPGTGSPDAVNITFRTAPAVTWWKAVEVLDADNNVITSLEAEGDNHAMRSAAVRLNGRNPNTMKLRFSKAKAFGVHTGMYCVRGLRSFLGATVSIDWMRD